MAINDSKQHRAPNAVLKQLWLRPCNASIGRAELLSSQPGFTLLTQEAPDRSSEGFKGDLQGLSNRVAPPAQRDRGTRDRQVSREQNEEMLHQS